MHISPVDAVCAVNNSIDVVDMDCVAMKKCLQDVQQVAMQEIMVRPSIRISVLGTLIFHDLLSLSLASVPALTRHPPACPLHLRHLSLYLVLHQDTFSAQKKAWLEKKASNDSAAQSTHMALVRKIQVGERSRYKIKRSRENMA
jgi:hypothetical protein